MTIVNRLQVTIRELMDAKGWGPSDLAHASGIPRQTLYNLLSPALADNGRQPRPSTLHKIARALGVPESQLLEAMNETRGYDVKHDKTTDPTLVALFTVAEMLPNEKREMLLALAKSMVGL